MTEIRSIPLQVLDSFKSDAKRIVQVIPYGTACLRVEWGFPIIFPDRSCMFDSLV